MATMCSQAVPPPARLPPARVAVQNCIRFNEKPPECAFVTLESQKRHKQRPGDPAATHVRLRNSAPSGDGPRSEVSAHQERHESRDDNGYDPYWMISGPQLAFRDEQRAPRRNDRANDLHEPPVVFWVLERESKNGRYRCRRQGGNFACPHGEPGTERHPKKTTVCQRE